MKTINLNNPEIKYLEEKLDCDYSSFLMDMENIAVEREKEFDMVANLRKKVKRLL